MAQLEAFAKPFPETLVESARRRHWVESIAGLLSTLNRKTGEGIADLHGQDRGGAEACEVPDAACASPRQAR